MFGAESRNDPARRADTQAGVFVRDVRMERDQPPEQRRPQQAATGLRVGLPVDEHLAAPQTGAGQLAVASEVSRQVGVGVCQSRLDAVQARPDVHRLSTTSRG